MSSDYSLTQVEVSSSPRDRFVEYLQSKGKRITQQRLQLVDHVFSRHEHFDAEELISGISQVEAVQASRATVYRTLEELVDAGLLRAMSLSGRMIYEHDYGYPQHDHLYCQSCEKLIEFHSDELQTIRDAVAREHNFRVQGHKFIVTGICQECSRKGHRRLSPLDLI